MLLVLLLKLPLKPLLLLPMLLVLLPMLLVLLPMHLLLHLKLPLKLLQNLLLKMQQVMLLFTMPNVANNTCSEQHK